MKRSFAALALTCLLSASALAGEIPTVGAPQPPPPGATSTISRGDIPISGVPGDMPTGGSSAALSVLLTIYGLLI